MSDTSLSTFPVSQLWRALPVALLVILTGAVFRDGLGEMAGHWTRAEYSHGYLIPLVALAMALQLSQTLSAGVIRRAWAGPALMAVALAIFFVGELSTIYPLIQYAFLIALAAIVLTLSGPAGLRVFAPALIYLAFMVPMPQFFYVMLTARLQLLSSVLGVALIRLFGIPVFLAGNVIDLGTYQLQVAEACSGLRYLLPLASFAFLAAYLYRGPFWQRAVLFLSALPITVLMNALRIGIIGVTVDRFGIAAAEGFTHLFEGWTVFALCLLLLFGEAALLSRLGPEPAPLRARLAIDMSAYLPPFWRAVWPVAPWPLGPVHVTLLLLAATLAASSLITHRAELLPMRQPLVMFPLELGAWHGRDMPIEPKTLARLQLTDYVLRDYSGPTTGENVNLYVSYYGSQRKGAAIHSPHNCIPAGGWEIESFGHTTLSRTGHGPLRVNRVVIRKGTARALVYYYFDQRGRTLTEEYQAKWFILVDAIARNRTDGALVRLVTDMPPDAPPGTADERLAAFADLVVPKLPAFVPE